MLLIVVEKQFLEDTSDTEREAKAAATMLTCLLSCAKDNAVSIVSILPKILSLIVTRVSICTTTGLRIRVLECGMSAIYYSPEATVSYMISDPNSKNFFNTLFSTFQVMENDSTQRLIVLSMSALLSLNSNALSEDIKMNVQNIFQQIIRELVFIEEQKIKDDNAEDGDDGSDGDDDGMYICLIFILMHISMCAYLCMLKYTLHMDSFPYIYEHFDMYMFINICI
jgi:hypothetical protein